MKASPTALGGVLVIEPDVFADGRGFFVEQWNARAFRAATGLEVAFVQDNHSRSGAGVLRGLHYQLERPQGRLVWVARGRVLDVVVDLRRQSGTFGKALCLELSETNHVQVWIPPGFAHGFLVLSENADFLYKTTEFYDASSERTIAWNDPDLAIPWPTPAGGGPILSSKDEGGVPFAAADTYP